MSRRSGLNAVAIAVLLLLGGCSALDPNLTVEYRIEGNANQVLVTFRTNTGSDSQRSASLPFGYKADFPPGAVVGVVAQNLDGQARDISCVLLVEDEIRDQQTASGASASVTCEGVADR